MKDYRIIHSQDLDSLEEEVNKALSEGNICIGGIHSSLESGFLWFSQAVAKPI